MLAAAAALYMKVGICGIGGKNRLKPSKEPIEAPMKEKTESIQWLANSQLTDEKSYLVLLQ